MLTPTTLIIIVKAKASLPLIAAALINFASAERARQAEIIREMGTLACQIENAKLVGRDSAHLQRQYEQLAKLVK